MEKERAKRMNALFERDAKRKRLTVEHTTTDTNVILFPFFLFLFYYYVWNCTHVARGNNGECFARSNRLVGRCFLRAIKDLCLNYFGIKENCMQ